MRGRIGDERGFGADTAESEASLHSSLLAAADRDVAKLANAEQVAN